MKYVWESISRELVYASAGRAGTLAIAGISLSYTSMPFRKTCSFRYSLWSCSRIGVRFIGEKPIAGIPTWSHQTNRTEAQKLLLPNNLKCHDKWMNSFSWRFHSYCPWPVLTARIKRLSVAAGNISFSRVIFLQKRYPTWDLSYMMQAQYFYVFFTYSYLDKSAVDCMSEMTKRILKIFSRIHSKWKREELFIPQMLKWVIVNKVDKDKRILWKLCEHLELRCEDGVKVC